MKSEGTYSFNVVNKNTGNAKEYTHTNYITKLYRYFSNYNRRFSWDLGVLSGKRHIGAYIFLVKPGSHFPDPLILDEPFESLNITGKGIVAADYITTGLGGNSFPYPRTVNDAYLTKEGAFFTMTNITAIDGPFQFRGALTCGANTLSSVYSALNFPTINVSSAEKLFVTFSVLNRWS